MSTSPKSPWPAVFNRAAIESEAQSDTDGAWLVEEWAKQRMDTLPKGDPLRAVRNDAAVLLKEFTVLRHTRLNLLRTIDSLRDQGVSWDNIGRILDCDGRSVRSWRIAWKPTRWPDL